MEEKIGINSLNCDVTHKDLGMQMPQIHIFVMLHVYLPLYGCGRQGMHAFAFIATRFMQIFDLKGFRFLFYWLSN